MSTVVYAPTQIKTGPGVIRYAPLGTAIPTPTTVANKLTATWTAPWVMVGGTDAGLSYQESVSAADVKIAESAYKIKTNVTDKSGSVRFNMSQVSDINWKLAANGGTLTVTGATTTKMSYFLPPLIGAEVRVMLSFTDLNDEEILVWPQVFNTGTLDTARPAQGAEKWSLPCEFAVELPDPLVLAGPYARWTSGPLSQG